jgi:hypothetical protein
MKLRILGNTLRLRLNDIEVEIFKRDHEVSDGIQFGDRRLTYTLTLSNTPQLSASYYDDRIVIKVPSETGLHWADGVEVGMTGRDGLVDILVEKDFV